MEEKGRIITFYSYKGGTGRSMALANIAWILASNGKKVLVIDWDLEAPGLHRYFSPFLRDSDLNATEGLIDFLFEYAKASLTKSTDTKTDWYLPYTDINRYTVSLNCPEETFGIGGTIDFVPAGKQDSNYSSKVNSFDWVAFYERLQGGAFLNIVKDQVKKEYDYILIDSRTGISDTSGICTIQMPDTLIACFTYNVQNIDGVEAIIDSVVRARKNAPISVFIVPTRVEKGEKDRVELARQYAKRKLGRFIRVEGIEKYWGNVEITYEPYYAYEEIISIFGDKTYQPNTMTAVMERIAKYITRDDIKGLVPPDKEYKNVILDQYLSKYQSMIKEKRLPLITEYSGEISKKDCFISYSNVDGLEFARKLVNTLERQEPIVSVWFDKMDLREGENWDSEISQAIKSCKCVLFIVSNDSVKPGSVCAEEIEFAIRYKKSIVPLIISQKTELPFILSRRQYINFTEDFDGAISRLRNHIQWLDSPEGVLQSLRDRLLDAQRDLRRSPENTTRIEAEIDDLLLQIKVQEKLVENPKEAQAQMQINIEAGLERERQPDSRILNTANSAKFINPPPGIAPTYFQDRENETKQIVDFLNDDAQRLVTVTGRGGVGKTAMVCRLLKGLEGGELPDGLGKMRAEGIVYLSESGSHRVNFANLFYDLCKLLPSEAVQQLDAIYKNPQATTASKMSALLDRFTAGKVVLLLDNVEPLISVETSDIADAELNECLRTLLQGAHSALKVILTTRVAPRGLNLYEPGRQRVLTLDTGLDQKYAVEMLREMDVDGKLGLKSVNSEVLRRAYEWTLGFPRALEALFAILASDRYTTLEELLAMPTPVNVVEALVGEAFNRLDTNAQKVMQALAVYNRPVTPAAVDYLLAPHIPAIDSAPILQRLANMHFARKESGRFYLHPADRGFAYDLIPVGENSEQRAENSDSTQSPQLARFFSNRLVSNYLAFTQQDLTSRAADYFVQARKPRAEWKKLDDLTALLAEFDLRCAASDYDMAASILSEVDYDYLLLWGHYRLLIELHLQLKDKISDKELHMRNLNILGLAYYFTGRIKESISLNKQGLESAQNINNRQYEGIFINNLGRSYASLGDINKAIEYYEQALIIVREIGDRKGEGNHLDNLGSAYAVLGETHKAIEFHEQSLAIARESRDRLGESINLSNLGIAYADLGNISKAIEYYDQAITIDREIGDRRGEGVELGNLGSAYVVLGIMDQAIQSYKQALAIAREIGDRSGEGSRLGNLGSAYALLGDIGKATDFHQQALIISREIGDRAGESIELENLGQLWLDTSGYEKSEDTFKHAIQIADDILFPLEQLNARIGLSETYLLVNKLMDARATIEAALGYDVPEHNHNASALHGIIALRQGDEVTARGAFVRAIGQADEILSKTAEYYDALDAKGIAICGLLICDLRLGRGAASYSKGIPAPKDASTNNTGRGDPAPTMDDAIETFRKARKIAPHAGIVKRNLRLFDELVKCEGGEILKDVRKAVEGVE